MPFWQKIFFTTENRNFQFSKSKFSYKKKQNSNFAILRHFDTVFKTFQRLAPKHFKPANLRWTSWELLTAEKVLAGWLAPLGEWGSIQLKKTPGGAGSGSKLNAPCQSKKKNWTNQSSKNVQIKVPKKSGEHHKNQTKIRKIHIFRTKPPCKGQNLSLTIEILYTIS